MDRRQLVAWGACLGALGGVAVWATLLNAEPSGGAFAWETHGPALPGQSTLPPAVAAPPARARYDETYPPLTRNASPVGNDRPLVRGPAAAPTIPSLPTERAPVPAITVSEALVPAAPVRPQPNLPPGLANACKQAELHVQRGTDLGNRRAYYSARAELIEALRLLAQSLDGEHHTDGHSQALAAGLKALDESDDFVARGQTFESELDVARISGVHRTPVVRSDPEGITPRDALQRYYTYAQEQLATGMGNLEAGSAALTALGKLYTVMAEDQPEAVVAAQAKSMALHQAALVVNGNNATAANELGVLLARFGRPQDALAWLEHSASLSPHAATWHNLAAVHQQLGQTQLAEQSRQRETEIAQRTGRKATSSLPDIRWVSPQELNAAPADRPAPPAAVPSAPGSMRAPPGRQTSAVPGVVPGVAQRPIIQQPGSARLE